LPLRIHPMNLENRLGDIETNRRDRLHIWSFQLQPCSVSQAILKSEVTVTYAGLRSSL